MFALVSGFWNWFTHKKELRFLIVGIDNAGKTTTLERIKQIYRSKTPQTSLDRITPTIGLNVCHVTFDRTWAGVFWDLGGQLMLRGIWENHYQECSGLIFVIDSTDESRLGEVRATYESVVNHPALYGRQLPVVLLINKQDVEPQAYSVAYIIKFLGLEPHLKNTHIIEYKSPTVSTTVQNDSSSLSSSSSLSASSTRWTATTQPNVRQQYTSTVATAVPSQHPGTTEMSSQCVTTSVIGAPSSLSSVGDATNPPLPTSKHPVRVVCVAGCSAAKNINIDAALAILVNSAKT